MLALFLLVLVIAPFAAWGLWPERNADGTPFTGVFPLAVDEHGRPTSPSLTGDTRR